jgi:hypothetical protein
MIFLCAALLLGIGPALPRVEARVYLELDSPNLRRVPIAVAPLQPLCNSSEDPKIAATGRKILLDDLEFSTFFEVLDDPATYLENPSIVLSPWVALIFVTGRCSARICC